MKNNLLESLKEKKNFMRLSVTALVGAASICAGTMFCSASAMKKTTDLSNFSTLQQELVDAKKETEGKDEKLYEKVQEIIAGQEDLCYVVNQLIELLENGSIDVINRMSKIAEASEETDIVDLLSMVKVKKFCDDHKGSCDLEMRTINLSECDLSDENVVIDLVDILKNDRVFWSLNLKMCKISDEGISLIADMLKINTKLEVLNLDLNHIADEGARKISDMLMDNTSLISLCLAKEYCGSRLVEEDLDLGAILLEQALNADSLSFLNNGYTVMGMKNKSYYRNRGITTDGLSPLSQSLRANTTIVMIDLSGHPIEDEGARLLSEVLMSNTNLMVMLLSHDKIGDEGAKFIGDSLKTNTSLTELDLSHNNMGEVGISTLSESLKRNSSLTKLDISGMSIHPGSLAEISNMLMSNTTLIFLDY